MLKYSSSLLLVRPVVPTSPPVGQGDLIYEVRFLLDPKGLKIFYGAAESIFHLRWSQSHCCGQVAMLFSRTSEKSLVFSKASE